MKKAALFLCLFLVIILVILGINTIRFTSKQVRAKPSTGIRVDAQKAAKRLSEAVKFKTISTQDPSQMKFEEFIALHNYLEGAFPKAHAVLKKEAVSKYSLLYKWAGRDDKLKPVILLGHLDVVPVEPGTEGKWTYPAFSGKIADGFIWGRGTLDLKVNVLGLLEAVENLAAGGFRPKRTVYLAFGHDEEVGGLNGAKKIAALLESRGVTAEYVLDEGGFIVEDMMKGITRPVAMVGIAEKGYLSIKLVVETGGGHSSMPPRETGVGILSKAIWALGKNPFPRSINGAVKRMFEFLGPEMPLTNRVALSNLWLLSGMVMGQLEKSPAMDALLHTTAAPTMLEGSPKENVLPSRAAGVVNFRILPGESIKSVTDYVKKTIDDSRVKIEPFTAWAKEPSIVSDIDSPSFRQIQKTVAEVFPGSIFAPYLVPGGTDSRNYSGITKNIFRFTPEQLKPDDLKRLHGTNERLSVKNYEEIIRFYIQLMRNSDSM